MFCTKCGFDAGDAKFCPKCGSPVGKKEAAPASADVQETVNDASSAAQTNAANNSTQTETVNNGFQQPNNGFTQPQAFGQVNNSFDQNQYGSMDQQPKAKKKWPLIAGIAVLVVAIIAAVAYFAYPAIADMVSPTRRAKSALKGLGTDAQTKIEEVLESDSLTADTKVDLASSLKAETVKVDGTDYLSYLKVNTVKYDVQANSDTAEVSGKLILCSDDSEVITLNFYTDSNYLYLSCPELFTETFKLDYDQAVSSYSSSGFDISDLQSASGSIDLETLQKNSKLVNAVVADVMKGYDTFIDNCQFVKKGKQTIETDAGKVKANEFEVIITKDALVKGFNAGVDALYSDKELSSYMSLITTMTGSSQDKIKSSFESELSDYTPYNFHILVKGKDLVKIFSEDGDDSVYVEFLGKKKSTDNIHFGVATSEAAVEATVKTEDDKKSELKFTVKDTANNTVDLTLDLVATKESDTKTKIDTLSLTGKADGTDIEIKLSGSLEIKDFTSLSLSKSDFKSPINVSNMTSSDQAKIATELVQNMEVLKKIVNDDLYDQLIGAMGLTTAGTTTSAVPAEYVGTWSASGLGITINADGTGTLSSSSGDIGVNVTISDGTITLTNPLDPTDYISYGVSVSGNTLTLTDTDGSTAELTKSL